MLRFLLLRKWTEHHGTQAHNSEDCPFCYMDGEMKGEWFNNNSKYSSDLTLSPLFLLLAGLFLTGLIVSGLHGFGMVCFNNC